MYSTGGIADRFADLVRSAEARMTGPLPAAVRFWDGSEFGPGGAGDAADTIVLKNSRALTYAVSRPDQLGIARAWVAGDVELEGDLYRVMAAGSRLYGFDFSIREKLEAVKIAARLGLIKVPPPKPPASEARPAGRLHSLRRDREVIQYHYDISNDFYRMILGPTMVYSCAYFTSPEDSLEDAQTRKLDLICRKLDLKPGERMLDIGCGWGSLIMHAAANYGVETVGVTLSEAQAAMARERIAEAGLDDRCEVRIQDYREVPDGPYDKIASIGMVEHVGVENIDLYAAQLRGLLAPDGRLLNHGITRLRHSDPDAGPFTERYV
ncbi:MAG: class I SAM-dependent methyltransferase, partial [Acidobacteriota bacterium]